MTEHRALDEVLRVLEGDAGCDAGDPILDEYVELELRGEIPAGGSPAPRSTCARAPPVAPITTGCSPPRSASAT